MAYTVPQFRLFQEFTESAAATTSSLAACVIGPHYGLHRFTETDEAALLGTYEPGVGFQSADFPDKVAGSTVDLATVELYIQNAAIETTRLVQSASSESSASSGSGDETPTASITATNGNRILASIALHTGNGVTAVNNFAVSDPVFVFAANGDLIKETSIIGFASSVVGGAYDIAILQHPLTGVTAETECEYAICKRETYALDADEFTALSTGVSVLSDLTKDGKAVLSGSIYVDYRELLTTYTNGVYDISSVLHVTGMLGPISEKNPLAMAVNMALLNAGGATVYFIAVATDDVDGYADALDIQDTHNDVYQIVPLTTGTAELAMIKAYILEASNPQNMNWRIGVFGCDVPTTVTSVATDLAGADLTVDITGSTVTFPTAVDIVDVNALDTLVMADGTTYTIEAVGVDSLELVETLTVPVVAGEATIVKTLNKAEMATAIAAYSSAFASERIRSVYCDGAYTSYDVNVLLSNVYVAAAYAGLRSGVAPHQPLTRAEMNGFAINNGYRFTPSNFNTMAEGGTLIVTNTGSTIYVRHQLTTNTTAYKLREDSKITNADEVSKTYKQALSQYFGRSNISDELITYLQPKVDGVAYNIATRPYSELIGKQILSAEPSVFTRDANLSDRLLVSIPITTPDPLNDFSVVLTIS